MSRATAVLNRVIGALNRVGPINDKMLYKRVITQIGDTLIGKVTSTIVDTIITPQPVIEHAGREHLSGARDPVETMTTPNGTRLTVDDYVITMSGSSLDQLDIRNNETVLALKDPDGTNVETLYIMDTSPVVFQGVIIVYIIYARSVQSQ